MSTVLLLKQSNNTQEHIFWITRKYFWQSMESSIFWTKVTPGPNINQFASTSMNWYSPSKTTFTLYLQIPSDLKIILLRNSSMTIKIKLRRASFPDWEASLILSENWFWNILNCLRIKNNTSRLASSMSSKIFTP